MMGRKGGERVNLKKAAGKDISVINRFSRSGD
jgi:hypothetical protein